DEFSDRLMLETRGSWMSAHLMPRREGKPLSVRRAPYRRMQDQLFENLWRSHSQFLPHELDQLRCGILRWADSKHRLVRNRLERHLRPGDVIVAIVQDHGIGAVEELLRRSFKVGRCGVEHGDVKVRAEKTHRRVGLKDGVVCASEF